MKVKFKMHRGGYTVTKDYRIRKKSSGVKLRKNLARIGRGLSKELGGYGRKKWRSGSNTRISKSQLRSLTEEIKLRRKKRLMQQVDQPTGNILKAKDLFFQ